MDASDLPPEILTLVERLRTPTESIWMCSASHEAASVFMIEEENISTARSMQEIGLSGGGGRVLHFERRSGEWHLRDEDEYIC